MDTRCSASHWVFETCDTRPAVSVRLEGRAVAENRAALPEFSMPMSKPIDNH